jgi:hypothetical protein
MLGLDRTAWASGTGKHWPAAENHNQRSNPVAQKGRIRPVANNHTSPKQGFEFEGGAGFDYLESSDSRC